MPGIAILIMLVLLILAVLLAIGASAHNQGPPAQDIDLDECDGDPSFDA